MQKQTGWEYDVDGLSEDVNDQLYQLRRRLEDYINGLHDEIDRLNEELEELKKDMEAQDNV